MQLVLKRGYIGEPLTFNVGLNASVFTQYMKGVFQSKCATFQSNCAEGLHVSALHCYCNELKWCEGMGVLNWTVRYPAKWREGE